MSILVECVYSQADSVYKHVYTFRQTAPIDKPSITIDSSFGKGSQARIEIRLKNNHGRHIWPSIISLISGDTDVIWSVRKTIGRFDTLILPGNYTLKINKVNYINNNTKFSIRKGENLHFEFHLAQLPLYLLTVYEIDSKIELTKKQIEKIKKCVQGKNDLRVCAEKNVYYVSVQI